MALSSKVTTAQEAVIDAIQVHQQKMTEVIQNTSEGVLTMETLAGDVRL